MPLYAYKCTDCEDSFEARRKFAEASAPMACPICEGSNTKKLLARIHVGGSGSAVDKSKPRIPLSMKSGHSCGPAGCACSGLLPR